MVLFNDESNHSRRMNWTANLLVETKKIFAIAELRGKVEESQMGYNRLIFKTQVNICKAASGVFGNFIIKLIAMRLEEHSNYRFECPQRKKFYYTYSFPMITVNQIPAFLSPLRGKFLLSTIIRGKPGSSKQAFHIASIDLFGEYS